MIKKLTGFGIILIAAGAVILGSCNASHDMEFQSAGTGISVAENEEQEAGATERPQGNAPDSSELSSADGSTGNEQKASLYVYVCGQVRCPGVYELEDGKRICDAVNAAGGMTGEAAGDYWNLAEPLCDGQMIYVPTEKEAKERLETIPGMTASEQAKGDGKVNINTADKEELMTISGIGEGRASAIISYREKNGAFGCIEDLTQVSGIGEALFNNIKDMIKVY